MSRLRTLAPATAGMPSSSLRVRPFWSTSTIADEGDSLPMDLSALGAHRDRCNGSRGRLFAVQCAADSLFGFLAPRIVTTVVAVAVVFGVGSLIL